MKFLNTEIDGFTLRERLQFARRTIRENPKLAAALILGDMVIGVGIALIVIGVFY